LSPNVSGWGHAFFIEAFGTAFLTFCIFAVTNPKNNVPSGAIAPIVGIAIGSMIVMLGNLTGYVLNFVIVIFVFISTHCFQLLTMAM